MILMFVILIAVFYFFMIRPENKRKKEAQQMRDSLKVGDNITTIGGIIGKVVSVDEEYEEIVIDSEGSLLRFTFRAINKEYTRPAFIHDDEVEDAEQTDEADDQAQVPVDKALETAENATQSDDSAQTADAEK